jgi:hypothetical protein
MNQPEIDHLNQELARYREMWKKHPHWRRYIEPKAKKIVDALIESGVIVNELDEEPRQEKIL